MYTQKYDEHELQRAIIFLSENFAKSGNNPKPVVLHSIRVADLLIANDAPEVSVIAALLHDVIEDTGVTEAGVREHFGGQVARMVQSLTHEKHGSYSEKLENSLVSYQDSASLGFGTLIIRACDLIDNSGYYHEAKGEDQKMYLYDKYTGFMTIAKDLLGGSDYWVMMERAFDSNVKPLRSLAKV